MKRKFIVNLILLLSLNLLIKPFWILGVDRAVQNTVGAEQYGFYFALLNFTFLFNIFLDLGLTNYNNRNVSRDSSELQGGFRAIVGMKMLLAIVYGIICFVAGLIIAYDAEHYRMLIWLVVNQFFLSFILYLRSNIAALQIFWLDSIFSVLDRVLTIAFCSILLWGAVFEGEFQIMWFVKAQTLALFISTIIAFIIVARKAKFIKPKWDFKLFASILKKSYPFAILTLLMAMYNRLDSVFIERILGGTLGEIQAGIYAQAFRLLDAFNMIAYLFSVLLLPLFSKMIKDNENVNSLVKLSFSMLFIFSFSIAIASHFYNHEIMNLLYVSNIDKAAAIFKYLMFSLVAISSTYIFGTLLTANGSLKQLNIVAVIGMVVNIVINIILIPKYYALGSAFASLSAQYLTAIAQIIIAYKIFNFKKDFNFIFRVLGFGVAITLVAYLLRQFMDAWMLEMLIFFGSCVLIAVITRLLDIKSFLKLLNFKE